MFGQGSQGRAFRLARISFGLSSVIRSWRHLGCSPFIHLRLASPLFATVTFHKSASPPCFGGFLERRKAPSTVWPTQAEVQVAPRLSAGGRRLSAAAQTARSAVSRQQTSSGQLVSCKTPRSLKRVCTLVLGMEATAEGTAKQRGTQKTGIPKGSFRCTWIGFGVP